MLEILHSEHVWLLYPGSRMQRITQYLTCNKLEARLA